MQDGGVQPADLALETVRLEHERGVATIVLDRPHRLNAWTVAMAEDLLAALAACESAEIGAVVITGAGRAFCSGADLSPENRPQSADCDSETYAKLTRYNPIFLRVRELAKPVIAAVNGPAVGIGCSLALSCDFVLAAESAFFLLAFASLGLTLDGGCSAWLPARAGFARATEMAMLGERIQARHAVEWGLANEAIPDERLGGRCTELAQRLAAGPTGAYAATKRLLNARVYAGLADQLELEARSQGERSASREHLEAVAAFQRRRSTPAGA